MKSQHKHKKRPEIDSSSKQGTRSRRVATLLLTRIIDDQRNLDALCDRKHGLKAFLALEDRDRALARAIVIVACRYRTRIEHALSRIQNRPPPKRARFLVHTLHVAAAQILFMDVPQRAAVDLAVSAIGDDPRTSRFRGFANAVLRALTREREKILSASEDLSPFPSWMEKDLRRDYGKGRLKKISQSILMAPTLDLSVKSNPQYWASKLDGTLLPNGSVRLSTSTSVMQLEGYDEGEWWVQDAAAAVPAMLLNPPTGAKVLELCAAPGGKTAQLAARGFKVTAVDVSKVRLDRLAENLERLKLSADLVVADIMEWQSPELFDAVLLDAPCSSTGTIRRHPDVLWTRTRDEVQELAELQFAMIRKAAEFVKPGGELVFSNCSMMKVEGENLLPRLKDVAPDLVLKPFEDTELFDCEGLVNGQGAVRSLPYYLANESDPPGGGMDGFFACRFEKL